VEPSIPAAWRGCPSRARSDVRVAWLALLLTGCSNILGIEDLSRATPDASIQPTPETFNFAVAGCATCSQQCSKELEACGLDRGCSAIMRELAKCGLDDAVCRARAERVDPVAARASTFLTLETCRRERCTPDCYGGFGFKKYSDNCACLDEKCAEAVNACVRSPVEVGEAGVGRGAVGDCERTFGCVLSTTQRDPDESYACLLRYGGGQKEANALRGCLLSASCDECPLVGAHDYACSKKYNWRPPPTPSFDWPIAAIDNTGGTRLPDYDVRVCLEAGCGACLVEVGKGNTGDSGVASIPIKGPFASESPCVRLHKEGGYDSTSHLGRPTYSATRDVWNVAVGTFKQAEDVGKFFGVTVDQTKALVVVNLFDCIFNPGTKLSVEPIDDQRFYYFVNDFPSTTATETGARGQAIALNVTPGRYNIRAKFGEVVVAERQFELLQGLNWVLLVPSTK